MLMKKILQAALAAAGLVGLTARVDAATLYAASAAGGPGTLYTLDSSTGAVLLTIGPLNDANSVNYPITGLAFHPTTGVLYGSTGNNPAATGARLVTINPSTGLVNVVGSFNAGPTNSSGNPATMADLAFDATGNLYGVGSIGGPQLYTIDVGTAQATLVGTGTGLTSTTGGGLAFVGGTAYGTPTASRFGTYNLTTGAFTNITNPVKPTGGGAYGALATNPDTGVLFGLNVGSGSPPPTALVTIAPTTGTVTNLGASAASVDAIAFGPDIVPEPGVAALLAPFACFLRRRSKSK
jgi:hypothetical protein